MAFAASKSSVTGGAAVALALEPERLSERTGAADPLGAPWLTRVARAVAVALSIAFVIALVSGSGADTASGRLGGDYPAFYAAGRLITSDVRSSMYDPARQAETQEGFFPGDNDDGLLYFAYPPHTALVYLPLSHLPYRVSYALHTVLMLGATVAALYLVRPMLPMVDRHFELAVIGAISFYPLYRAITGGQNTAISLLLLAGSWRAVAGRRDVLSGVLLGLLLFKPQFALPIIGLHLLARRWRLGLSAALTAVACWVVGAALLGFGWLGDWFESVRFFSDLDAQVNRRNAVSFLGVADTVFGVGDTLGRAVGALLAMTTVAAADRSMAQSRPAKPLRPDDRRAAGDRADLSARDVLRRRVAGAPSRGDARGPPCARAAGRRRVVVRRRTRSRERRSRAHAAVRGDDRRFRHSARQRPPL